MSKHELRIELRIVYTLRIDIKGTGEQCATRPSNWRRALNNAKLLFENPIYTRPIDFITSLANTGFYEDEYISAHIIGRKDTTDYEALGEELEQLYARLESFDTLRVTNDYKSALIARIYSRQSRFDNAYEAGIIDEYGRKILPII